MPTADREPTGRFDFDTKALYRALDDRRQANGLSWNQLAGEVGVAPSTIRRMPLGGLMEVDGMRAMARWLGLSPENFMRGPRHLAGTPPLPAAATGKRSRFDTAALYAALDDRRRARHWSWARMATEFGTTPGSLTGLRNRRRIGTDMMARLVGWLGVSVESLTYEADH